MEKTFSPAKISAQEKFSVGLHGRAAGRSQNAKMPSESSAPRPVFKPTLIRRWRKYRAMTLEKLAEASGMSPGNLSNIERGITGYGQETLESLARALDCEPGELLLRDPYDPAPIWQLWDTASPSQQKQIIAIIEGLLKSSAA